MALEHHPPSLPVYSEHGAAKSYVGHDMTRTRPNSRGFACGNCNHNAEASGGSTSCGPSGHNGDDFNGNESPGASDDTTNSADGHPPMATGLLRLGWNDYFDTAMDALDGADLRPARVVGVRKNGFLVADGEREYLATASGALLHGNAVFPATGDWVALRHTIIAHVLPRMNTLSRGASGTHDGTGGQAVREQIIAANLDTVFVVCGLDRDFNLRRIERYLTLVYNCGLTPAVVLTKADLHPKPEACMAEVEGVAFGVPVHLVAAYDDTGPLSLHQYLSTGKTAAMIGSSGAGKSTLANRLAGRDVQLTSAVSGRLGKGRHTTTSRDGIALPMGGLLIDNPGIREIALWDDGGGLGTAFPDIDALAEECRFADCRHESEPGCRVLEALANGELAPDRLENYRKLQRELAYQAQRRGKSAARVERERWKDVAITIKSIKKGNYKK